jgi:hypothetical protein
MANRAWWQGAVKRLLPSLACAISPADVANSPACPRAAAQDLGSENMLRCRPRLRDARFWFGGRPIDSGVSRDAGTRFDATIDGGMHDYFLRESFALSTSPGTSRRFIKARISASRRGVPGSAALGGGSVPREPSNSSGTATARR